MKKHHYWLVLAAMYVAVAVVDFIAGWTLAGIIWLAGACIWVFAATVTGRN